MSTFGSPNTFFISGGVEGAEQKGKETFYPKMTRKNNELDPNKTKPYIE